MHFWLQLMIDDPIRLLLYVLIVRERIFEAIEFFPTKLVSAHQTHHRKWWAAKTKMNYNLEHVFLCNTWEHITKAYKISSKQMCRWRCLWHNIVIKVHFITLNETEAFETDKVPECLYVISDESFHKTHKLLMTTLYATDTRIRKYLLIPLKWVIL